MDDESTVVNTFIDEEMTDHISNSAKDSNTMIPSPITFSAEQTAAIEAKRRRIIQIQNFHLIWLDSSIDESDEDCCNFIAHLRRVVNTINTFIDPDECADFLTEIKDYKAFMIVSGYLGRRVIPLLHDISQLDLVYVFCENIVEHEIWAKEWSKVKGVFTDVNQICQALKQASRQFGHNSISISSVSEAQARNEVLDQLEASFMYTQILKEILFEIEYDKQAINELSNYCRGLFANNEHQLEIIDQFEQEYHHHRPIWWYTRESILYGMINRALRCLDIDIIIKAGFFIRDLHNNIAHLYHKQFTNESQTFIVYRGQGLSKTDFQQLFKTRGGLISFKNFLTASADRYVSLAFAESNTFDPNLVGVIFKITVDPSVSSVPFAYVDNTSYYQEEREMLFSMLTVFRIGDINQIGESYDLWQVELTLTCDNDPQLSALTEHLREETKGPTAWHRLGKLLIQMGDYDKAEQVYADILDRISNNSEKATLYRQFGQIKAQQGHYVEAISFYEKSAEIEQKASAQSPHDLAMLFNDIGAVYDKMGDYTKALTFCEKALGIYRSCLPSYHPNLADSYSDMGSVYDSMGDYPKALSYYEKALEIYKKTLPANHPNLAVSYNNIGRIYASIGEYSKALSIDEKALEIYQKTLPADHPDLGRSYNNIGSVYDNMGEYSKALAYYEKALEIYEKTLPSNHPDLAQSCNHLGSLYYQMGEYSRALSFYHKALKMYKKTLPSNHPSVAISYNNIGKIHASIGAYSTALSYYENALEIYQKTLPANHPDLGRSYNNIGLVYGNIDEYPRALSYYETALEIYQKTLPANHPNLAISYNNIGLVYANMGDYPKALSCYETALEIREKTLPANHPNLADSYSDMGSVYDSMGDYPKALSFYEKALEIYKKTLPANHPNLAVSYNNIGRIYASIGEYSKALSIDEKALEIYQKTLPADHPDLGRSYNNIGSVYGDMCEYSKALSYYEKALEIYQNSLPANHPDLGRSYNNIGSVYDNMGEYSKALAYYEKALEIYQKSVPANHPDLGRSYNNIGSVYDNMGEYSKALACYEKALEIYQKTLPSNHLALAQIPNSIGMVYYRMKEYLKALSFYEKACGIFENSHLGNHIDLAKVYDNISLVYYNLNEYSKALSFNLKALEIRQKILPASHPDSAASYDELDGMYNKRGEYSKALSFYEKALQASKNTVPPNHSDLITSYNNMGLIYFTMQRYSAALSVYQQAREICEKVFPDNHLHLATAYNNIGSVYYNMCDYSKALPFYQKVLEIYKKNLSPNHPDLATAHKNLGALYDSMSDYPHAILFYEKAVDIWQNALPADHPALAASLNNMGTVYYKIGYYPKALLFFKKALEIYLKTLPSCHPHLTQCYKVITLVQSKMDEISKATDSEVNSSINREQNTSDIFGTSDHGKEHSICDTTDLSIENAYIPSAQIQCSDPIDLSLLPTNKYGLNSSKQSQTPAIYEQLYSFSQANGTQTYLKSVSNDKPNILIVCLDVDSSLISLNPCYPIEPFNDECACVTRLLSITDACIYFVTSASIGEYIIPLVYRHQCIEQIYIYCSKDKQQNILWTTQVQKIQGCWTDFDEINAAINKDIQSFLSQTSVLSGSNLVIRCHTQTLDESSTWSLIPIDILNVVHNQILNDQIRIVILHSGRHIFFHVKSDRFRWVEFSDSAKCVQFLAATNIESVFFIVSGGIKSIMRDLQAITMLKQIYTVYIFMQFIDQDDLNKMILEYKHVNGLFCTIEDVFSRLVADIKFFLEQSLSMPSASFFTGSKSMKEKFPLKLSQVQCQFTAFQLFIKTLRQMPSSIVSHQKLYDRCLAYAENKSDCKNALEISGSRANLLIDWFVNVPFLSAVINSLLQQQTLNSLFNIQHVLVAVDRYITELPKIISSLVVYRAQLIRAQDLEVIQNNIDELVAFHTFVVATKDFGTIREIARQAANSGYYVVIFEIEIPKKTHVAKIDENRFMFQFGSIFRIQSINLAPDAIWYVRLKYAESNFEFIQEQLQLQVGEGLSWLTLGNYLSALNHFDEARSYYEHLIKTLPDDDKALPSIYNNMGLVNMELGNKEEALEYYKIALKSLKVVSPGTDRPVRPTLTNTLSESKQDRPIVNRSDVYDKMAEAYLGLSNSHKALEFYRKALEMETEPVLRARLEQKIKKTLLLIPE